MQTADACICHHCARLTAGRNLSELFVDCRVTLIVCLHKYKKCLVLSINRSVTFLTFLTEGL